MKRLIPVFALAIMMSACVKPTEPIRFSILGDSYSAFEGYVDPETNDVYPYEDIDVTSAEQMWWYKVADSTGWLLDRNNSFSGSLICNFEDYLSGNYYASHSFIRRMDNLGRPDVIFIFGGNNDACANNGDNIPVVPLGYDIFSDWTDEQLCTFRPALAYLFDGLRQMYPHAELYFLVDLNLGSDGIDWDRRDAFIGAIHRVASHYNVKCIDLEAIHKSQWHPNAEGQGDIARQVMEALRVDFNI